MLFAQLMCSVVVSGDLLRGGAELPPREEPRLLPTLLSVLGSADAFQVGGPLRAPQRSASPVMQLRNPFKAPAPAPEPAKGPFGLSNPFQSPAPAPEPAKGGPFGLSNPFQSPEPDSKGVVAPTKAVSKPALKKFKQNDKAVARGVLPVLAVLGAPVGGGLAILLATALVSPSLVPDELPFNFLDRFYPPAIERKARVDAELKRIQAAKEAAKKAAAEAEAAKKAAAEAEAKKAEEEKKAEEAKNAKAAPKAAAKAPAPAPAAAPKPAPAPPPAKKSDLVLTAPKGATTTLQSGAQPFRAPTPAGEIAKGGASASDKAVRPGTPDGLGQSACFPRARCDEVKGFRRNEAGTQYLGSDLLGLPAPGSRRNAFDANGESNKFYDLITSRRKAAQEEADQLAAAQQKAFAAQQAAAKAKAEALRAGKAVEAAAQDAKPAQVLTGKKGLGKLFGPLGYGTRTSLEAAGGSIYAYPGAGALPQELSTGSSYKTGARTVVPRDTSRPNSKEGTMGADVKKASTGPTDIRGSARLASYEKAKAAELRAKAEAKAAETAARNAEKEEALAEQRVQAAQAQAEKIAAREAKQAAATQQQQELVAAQQARIDQARAERAAR